MTETKWDFRSKYTSSGRIGRRLIDRYFACVGEMISGLDVRTALEVGCGEGFSTQRLRRLLPSSVAFEASDVEERLVRAAAATNPGVPIRRESIHALDRPSRSADLVFVLEVLEHLEEPDRALAEVCRVSGRWVLASVPREPWWRICNLLRLRHVRHLGNTPGHVQHWGSLAFPRCVRRFADVRAVRRPLPWTMVLAEVRSPDRRD